MSADDRSDLWQKSGAGKGVGNPILPLLKAQYGNLPSPIKFGRKEGEDIPIDLLLLHYAYRDMGYSESDAITACQVVKPGTKAFDKFQEKFKSLPFETAPAPADGEPSSSNTGNQ